MSVLRSAEPLRIWSRASLAPFVATMALVSGAPARAATTAPQAADAAAATFASKDDAEAFLKQALIEATVANPKYRSPGSDLYRRWITEGVDFPKNGKSGVTIATGEIFQDFRGGKQVSHGTHETRFALDDVVISQETTDDVAEKTGERAQGIKFTCPGEPCIHAVWDSTNSMSAMTDIYIQDAATREKILAALETLQRR